jgi:hypothetical protein
MFRWTKTLQVNSLVQIFFSLARPTLGLALNYSIISNLGKLRFGILRESLAREGFLRNTTVGVKEGKWLNSQMDVR